MGPVDPLPADLKGAAMGDESFTAMATVLASTKRNPAAVNGKVGAPLVHLDEIRIVPLMPVSPETAEQYQLRSPRETKQTFVEGASDIQEGDRLVVAGVEYVIRAVGEWTGADADYREVLVEQLKVS